LNALSRTALWLHRPGARRLAIPAPSAEVVAYRWQVMLAAGGLGLAVAAVLGLLAATGWTWGWLGIAVVLASLVWGLTFIEAKIQVLPYLQLLEGAYVSEERVYVADAAGGQARLSVGDIAGEQRDYQVTEINVGAGLDWNAEPGRQNLAATILHDALDARRWEGEGAQGLGEQLVQGYAADLAVFLFRRKEQDQIVLRENFSTTRRAVINFVAARI
jgi:hypothetical protein